MPMSCIFPIGKLGKMNDRKGERLNMNFQKFLSFSFESLPSHSRFIEQYHFSNIIFIEFYVSGDYPSL